MNQCSISDYIFYTELLSTITGLLPPSLGKKKKKKKKKNSLRAPEHWFAIGRAVDQNTAVTVHFCIIYCDI